MSDIEVRKISGGVGVEIANVDISKPLSNAEFSQIRDAFIDHGLIFFRDQNITPEQHIEFAERWAPININRFFAQVEGYEKIAQVLKEKDQLGNIGGGWHTDHSYDHIPAMGSILLARETPPVGGDTLFSCMYKAYETLSPGLQATLEGMRAIHSSRHIFGEQSEYVKESGPRLKNADQATQDANHPVVITHPESGRKALYVNPAFTLHFDGWTKAESAPLLDYLYTHAARMEHTTRFQWQDGSSAFWDNRCTWHFALNDYHGERRLMHRITLEGSSLN